MNRTNFLLIFIFFVVLSNTCQSTSTTSEKRVVTIAVDTDDTPIVPDVDEKSSYTQYGPGQTTGHDVAQASERVETVGIIIGASEDFDTSAMDYISCLIKSDIKINFIAGVGSSAPIAALFAQAKKPEFVKWKFFRLKERDDSASIIEELELSTRKIKRSNIAFYLTDLTNDTNIVFSTKGSILNNIKKNIEDNKKIMNAQALISESDISQLVANKVFVFTYSSNLEVSKNDKNGKMIHIKIPRQNFSLMKKCEIIKENL